jgi:cytochrome c-type biogenesis protein CcmH/NrfG
MPIGSIFASLAVLLLVAVYVMRPFLKPGASDSEMPTPYDDLEAQKEVMLQQIRELEFDHDTGKLPDDEFATQRADLVQQAAVILRQMDEYDSAESVTQSPANLDEQIEAAVARRRKTKTPL